MLRVSMYLGNESSFDIEGDKVEEVLQVVNTILYPIDENESDEELFANQDMNKLFPMKNPLMKIITVCPTCAKQNPKNEDDMYICNYCGTEYVDN